MRRTRLALVSVALGSTFGALALHGCGSLPEECEKLLTCPGMADGGDGGNPACEADPTTDPGAVIDDCGVFVRASAEPGGDGTKAWPFRSFAEAAGATPRRIYACAEEYAESAGVSFSGGVEIYAGFMECGAGWTWSASAKATLSGPADEVALTVSEGDSRAVNLNVVAASASADGGSSIAVIASGGTLAIVNGDITAGDAKDGAPGAQHAADPALDGDPGDPGVPVCMAGASNVGPAGKTKTCATGGMSVAGKGGDGGEIVMSMPAVAGTGGDGTPADASQPAKGVGGTGEGQGMPAATECSSGTDGASGAPGDPGVGATGIGTITPAGYAGSDGAAGTNGKPGQGGGGGGGAKGGLSIDCGGMVQNRVGASGGAGGTGGCGGQSGGGGQAGGSSIALVVVGATVTLEGVTLTAAKAGAGGKGGDGQVGGAKGPAGGSANGAGMAKPSCSGGEGGAGGLGAPGGGGQGGHSLGIAFQGTTPPAGGEFIVDPQNRGVGGPGGLNNSTPEGGKGTDGIPADCWNFSSNTSCEEVP